jgi:hypothetical protein
MYIKPIKSTRDYWCALKEIEELMHAKRNTQPASQRGSVPILASSGINQSLTPQHRAVR